MLPSSLQPLKTTVRFSICVIFSSSSYFMLSGIMQHLSFSGSLISVSRMSSRVIHVLAYVSISLLVKTEKYFSMLERGIFISKPRNSFKFAWKKKREINFEFDRTSILEWETGHRNTESGLCTTCHRGYLVSCYLDFFHLVVSIFLGEVENLCARTNSGLLLLTC